MKEEIIDIVIEYAIVGAVTLACFCITKVNEKINDKRRTRIRWKHGNLVYLKEISLLSPL